MTNNDETKNEWQIADEAYEAAENALVPMAKDGEATLVHPTAVEAHVKAGWTPKA